MATSKQDEATRPYRLAYGSHSAWDAKAGTHVRASASDPNSVVYLTDAQARSMGDRFIPVEPGQYAPSVAIATAPTTGSKPGDGEVKTGAPPSKGTLEGAPEATDWANALSDLSAGDVVTLIKDDNTTADDVRAIRRAEAAGQNRKTIIEAADKRLGK